MAWDYAELSHMAKEAGGPDLLLKTLESNARSQGRIEGAGVGALVAGAVLTGAALLYNQYNKRKALAEAAKVELEEGIRAYDTNDSVEESEEAAKEGEETSIQAKSDKGEEC